MKRIEIVILEMGGTINGILDPDSPAPEDSRVVCYLQKWGRKLGVHCSFEIVTMKDSRAIKACDREALAEAVRRTAINRVLIPHGTFTIAETGEFLQDTLGINIGDKSIVLVGAMIPLGEPNSDAIANIEFAIQNLLAAPRGVWVAINGKLWYPNQVVKDLKTGEFRKKLGCKPTSGKSD